MLHLVTGTPGASKTAFVVTQMDKLERLNYINVRKNKVIYEHNLNLFEKFKEEFTYYTYEEGSGAAIKTIIEPLSDDYFDFLKEDYDDLRPDDYFKKTTRYNEIVERINDMHGQQKFEFFQPVRTIYTNIKALKIPYTRALIHDWRDAPDGSVFVLDEVQLIEPYSNKKSEDKIILDLTVHRHRGFDFYFITQAPRFLHPVVKDLIGCHYHITRPFGWTPKVYQYGSARDNPNALVNKINCEQKFSFKPTDRIFTLYKSTTINTHKKRIPKFVYVIGGFIFCSVSFFIYNITQPNALVDNVTGKEGDKKQSTSSMDEIAQVATTNVNLDQECRKSQNVEKKQCVEWFDNLSKNKGSIGQEMTVLYDPNKPFDTDELHKTVSYQPTTKPYLSGCMTDKNGNLVGYSQQGTRLNVSQSDCQKIINGDRPFNYFKNENQNYEQSTNADTKNNYQVSSQQDTQTLDQVEQTNTTGA
ncbi:zonular occludens toxin domain-containing protein [Acinetobacter haemolyticus]|uniref:zonular occludens toxin domain-containing protein n=1 Tax=Acinetobacter haemolyticus TaxID=29430 RepID=UPI002A69997C|nr:zonular occludens toxin domain-containing protein [Acinetobacter haemolyticus]WPO66393.1 zonular occludens toxin domain-containing protein [Acinetobacter haemolyticus]